MDVDEILEHFGTKGMKWGVRKDKGPEKVTTKVRPGKRVKAKGGRRQRASQDAIKTAMLKQKAKKSTTDSLTNKQLKTAIERMRLEQQYSELRGKSSSLEMGKMFVQNLVGLGKTADSAYSTVKTASLAKDIGSALKK